MPYVRFTCDRRLQQREPLSLLDLLLRIAPQSLVEGAEDLVGFDDRHLHVVLLLAEQAGHVLQGRRNHILHTTHFSCNKKGYMEIDL